MTMKSITTLPIALFALLAATSFQVQAAGCDASDRIDGSTARGAQKKMEQAGYLKIHGLAKGCDNYWHGQADKGGSAVNIVLSPQGNVMIEGN